MNVLLSLLIYNPIEAYTMTLLCDIITGNRVKFKKINVLYMIFFSAVNFIIQIVPNIFKDSIIYILLQILCEYMLIPVSIFIFYKAISNSNVSIRQCIVAQLINSCFIMALSFVISVLFGFNNVFHNSDILSEFISNLVIFSVQISLYTFIKIRSISYEKLCKTNCRKEH